MKMRMGVAAMAALAMTTTVAPVMAQDVSRYRGSDRQSVQTWRSEQDNRQKNKNQWRNLAIGAGALGVIGLLKHDNTLTAIGAAGAAYSAHRYEQDRHSQSQQQSDRDSWRSYHRRW